MARQVVAAASAMMVGTVVAVAAVEVRPVRVLAMLGKTVSAERPRATAERVDVATVLLAALAERVGHRERRLVRLEMQGPRSVVVWALEVVVGVVVVE